jgi:hypothetical protein
MNEFNILYKRKRRAGCFARAPMSEIAEFNDRS